MSFLIHGFNAPKQYGCEVDQQVWVRFSTKVSPLDKITGLVLPLRRGQSMIPGICLKTIQPQGDRTARRKARAVSLAL